MNSFKRYLLAGALTLLLCAGAAAQSQLLTGKVIGVSDGDTFTLLDQSNQEVKIRFNGIDAPERSQPFGNRSRQELAKLIFGKTVTVDFSKIDRYGRPVGKVTLDRQDIGLVQIRRGMAWFFRQYEHELSRVDARLYDKAEAAARGNRRGLWVDPNPAPPWEVRAARREAASENAPPPAPTDGRIIGNRNSRIYHRPDCPSYSDVSERNRVFFKTTQEAEAAGFRAAGNCPKSF